MTYLAIETDSDTFMGPPGAAARGDTLPEAICLAIVKMLDKLKETETTKARKS